MKKTIISVICIVLLLANTTVFAGSFPEDFLWSDEALVFFGEIVSFNADNSVTVLPTQNIKGDIEIGVEQTYARGALTLGGFTPRAGNLYLMGYYDENNPLVLFNVSSTDTATLQILNSSGGGMEERMQEYLNNGDFERAEIERLARLGRTYESPPTTNTPVPQNSRIIFILYIAITIGIFGILTLLIFLIIKKRK